MKEQFKQWLKIKGLKDRTLKNYMFYYDRLGLTTIDQESLNNFLTKNNNGVSRAFLKNLIHHIKTNDYSEELKTKISKLYIPKLTGRKKRRIPKTISKEEVHIIAKAMTKERNRVMVLVNYYAGVRLEELIKIKPYDFNWNSWIKEPRNLGELRVIGKGDKERIIPIVPWLMNRILEWIKKEVSTKQDQDKPLFNIKGRRYQDILGKTANKTIGKWINPHLLRHSYGTYLSGKGLSLKEIADLYGHQSVSTTALYIHPNKEQTKNKIREAFK
jgi:site-specific recombinase XerD